MRTFAAIADIKYRRIYVMTFYGYVMNGEQCVLRLSLHRLEYIVVGCLNLNKTS